LLNPDESFVASKESIEATTGSGLAVNSVNEAAPDDLPFKLTVRPEGDQRDRHGHHQPKDGGQKERHISRLVERRAVDVGKRSSMSSRITRGRSLAAGSCNEPTLNGR
jgi:hypothetical protein